MQFLSPEAIEPGHSGAERHPRVPAGRPLVVDLDMVLMHVDFSIEAVLSELTQRSDSVFGLLAAAIRGPAALKRRIADTTDFDPARLAYNPDTVTFMLQVLAEGRPVYLASDHHDGARVSAIAQHLGVFTAWSGSADGAARGADALSLPPSSKGFDYLGFAATELPDGGVRITRPASDGAVRPNGWRVWAKLLRVHQYAKNALILVPLLTAHQFGFLPIATALLAALAFSLCASSAYILNDLVDVKADRAHATKRHRPVATGAVSPARATAVMLALLATAVMVAATVSLPFLGVLLVYLALTTAYSFKLKRVALIDVVTLAVLYTIRVIAGAVAIGVTMSEWLFAFSLFIFMSLALVKRYIELRAAQSGERLPSRDYSADDLSMIAVLAAAAGFNAVVVFTLYISSDTVRALYAHPQALWIGCPILMYWIARVMLLAQRGQIDDDPVIFALRDRVSWVALGAIGAIMLVAI
jgi:4-hydroxybenzoate polyprenyltransferase